MITEVEKTANGNTTKVSSIEQRIDEISLEVKNVEKSYNSLTEMDELRNNFGSEILSLQSALGTFSSDMNTYMKDNKLTDEEESQITTHKNTISEKLNKLNTQIDTIIQHYTESEDTEKVNGLTASKTELNASINNLYNCIETAIVDDIFTDTEIANIISYFGKANVEINECRNLVDDYIFLGVGGKIIEEISSIKLQQGEIGLEVKRIEDNITEEVSSIKLKQDEIALEVKRVEDDVTEEISSIKLKQDEIELEVKRVEDEASANLSLTADSLTSTINNKVDNLQSQITQNADSIKTKVDAEYVGSQIEQTKDSITSTVYDELEGYVDSQIKQTSDSITTTINNKTDDLQSQITQNADSIKTKVDAGYVNSQIEQSTDSITTTVNNEIENLQTQITQNAESIKTKVDAEYVNSQIEQSADSITSTVNSDVRIYIDEQMDGAKEEIHGEVEIYVGSQIEQTVDSITTTVNNKVDNLQSQITQNADSIKTKVDAEYVTSQIEQSANSITTTVNNEINNLQTQITQNSNSISTKVDAEYVNSQITQNADSITSTVSKEIDNKITQSNGVIYDEFGVEIDNLQSQITQNQETIYDEFGVEINNLQTQITQNQATIYDEFGVEINRLQSQITQNADSIELKVTAGEVTSYVQQTLQEIKLGANQITLEGYVTINDGFKIDNNGNMFANNATLTGCYIIGKGEGNRIKINNGDYEIQTGNVTKGFFGTRTLDDGYDSCRLVMSTTGVVAGNGDYYFAIQPFNANANPQSHPYPYVDLSYRCQYFQNDSGDTDASNIKMYGDGDIRLAPLNRLMITTNGLDGGYGGTAERLVAEFGSTYDEHYNFYEDITTIRNYQNNNGLLLVTKRNDGTTENVAKVVLAVYTDGTRTFKPMQESDGAYPHYLGTPSYRWQTLYSVNALNTSSDITLKTNIEYLSEVPNQNAKVSSGLNIHDMYNFVKDDLYLTSYNWRNSDDTSLKIGFIAQDIVDTKIGEKIITCNREQDKTLGYDSGNYVSVLAGALKVAIQKIEDLTNELNDLKNK